jgi:hypothetical protein
MDFIRSELGPTRQAESAIDLVVAQAKRNSFEISSTTTIIIFVIRAVSGT